MNCILTVESFCEQQDARAEEYEQINNLLTVILDVMSYVLQKHGSLRVRFDARFRGSAECMRDVIGNFTATQHMHVTHNALTY
jgi:hypothetical protein